MAGPERAVAATKSYTAQLFTLYLLVNAVAGDVSFQGDELIETANSVVSRKNQWLEVADRYSDISRLLVTARGYHYASALEVALKIMETSYIDAHAFSGADLLHGPMAMVDVDTPVLAIVPDGLSANSMKPLLSRLSETTNRLIVAGGLIGEGIRGSHVNLRHDLNESLSPIIDIIALQYFAWKMAIDRGHDPDHPRGLSKVTQTL
jgi:glucosamine--fructose-6-phosphate aminotransferase (isomerizing)